MRIHSIWFKSMLTKQQGFTLIESLMIVAILGVMGLGITEIFLRTMRSSSTSQVISLLKQNGQVALNQIDDTLKFAISLECPITAVPLSSLVVKTAEGKFIKFELLPETPTSNSRIRKQEFRYNNLGGGNSLCSTSITSSTPGVGTDSLRESILTDADPIYGVQIKDLYFQRITPAGATTDILKIKFKVYPGKKTPRSAEFLVPPADFETSIVIRGKGG